MARVGPSETGFSAPPPPPPARPPSQSGAGPQEDEALGDEPAAESPDAERLDGEIAEGEIAELVAGAGLEEDDEEADLKDDSWRQYLQDADDGESEEDQGTGLADEDSGEDSDAELGADHASRHKTDMEALLRQQHARNKLGQAPGSAQEEAAQEAPGAAGEDRGDADGASRADAQDKDGPSERPSEGTGATSAAELHERAEATERPSREGPDAGVPGAEGAREPEREPEQREPGGGAPPARSPAEATSKGWLSKGSLKLFGKSTSRQGGGVEQGISLLEEDISGHDEAWYAQKLEQLRQGMTCTKVATNGKPYERVLKVDAKNLTIQVCGGKGGATGLLLDDVEDLRGGLASSEFEKFHAELSSKVSLMPDLSERALVLKTSNRTFSFLLKSAGCRTNVSHCVLYLLKSKKRGVMAPGRAPGHAEDHRTPKDGHGTATYNRSTYTGQFRNRKRHGHGVLTLSDGTRYESEWRDDVRHGKGKEHCLDGTTFEGEYVNGMREGPGVMTWPEGSKYRGQFREGRANGNGELLRTDGSIYTGQFYEDCMQGEGCMQWKDGVRYEGQFQCNLREGRGLMLWVSGKWKSYDGKWKEGCQHGSGVLTDHNGREFRGVFKQGKLERWVDS